MFLICGFPALSLQAGASSVKGCTSLSAPSVTFHELTEAMLFDDSAPSICLVDALRQQGWCYLRHRRPLPDHRPDDDPRRFREEDVTGRGPYLQCLLRLAEWFAPRSRVGEVSLVALPRFVRHSSRDSRPHMHTHAHTRACTHTHTLTDTNTQMSTP